MKSGTHTKKLLLILVVVVIGAFLNKYLIKEDFTYYTPAKGEARFNPYYAAQLLLQKYGISASTMAEVEDRSFLDSKQSFILFISDTKIYQQPVLLNAITAWVKNGGVLILPVNFFSGRSLKEYIPGLDVTTERVKDQDFDDRIIKYKNQYDIEISHQTILKSELESLWSLKDEHGQHIVALPYEKGQIILFNDLSPFNNAHIAEHDHAAVFLDILKNTGVSHIIHILYPDTPGLFSILGSYPLQLILFFAIILFFIWKIWGYFGPVNNNLTSDHQHFIKHLEFSGQYLWRNVDIGQLYRILYGQLEKKIQSAIPGWSEKTDQEKISLLSDLVSLDEKDLQAVLLYKPDKDKHGFLTFTRNIIKIRNAI